MPELAQTQWIDAATTPTDDQLRTWDWPGQLGQQERSFGWLGRKTDRSQSAVSRYAHGSLSTPIEWLRDAWRVMNPGRAA